MGHSADGNAEQGIPLRANSAPTPRQRERVATVGVIQLAWPVCAAVYAET